MRIIKAAKLETEREEICYNCKSVLGVTMNDLEWKDTAWGFRCAVCGKRTQYAVEHKEDLFKWIMEDSNDGQLQSDNSVRINAL